MHRKSIEFFILKTFFFVFFLLHSCITLFQNETTNKFSREILLEHVTLQLNMDDERDHCFEIRTEQHVFLCGCKRTRSRVC